MKERKCFLAVFLILISVSSSEIIFKGKMLYVLYKKWGWLLSRKGACLSQVDVKNGLLLVALNEIKLFYPWSCFYNFASSQKHFNLKGKLHTPTQISLSCSNESLRREVVLKVKVETGCSIEWCVSGALGRTGIPQNWGQALCVKQPR